MSIYYLKGTRTAGELEGDEKIMFAGTAWDIHSVFENARGGWTVKCELGEQTLEFTFDSGANIDVLIPDEAGR